MLRFPEIRDQAIPVRLLRNIIAQERIPNGLMFWGPSGVGKSSTALAFARALNCQEPGEDDCGECLSCRKIANGNHPDVHLTVPVGKTRLIKKDAVEQVVELASLRPFEAEWRIFLIQQAERMNPSSQNHLLKTLEEPPGKCVFILVTEQPQLLLPTIRSRCQTVRFGSLRPETVAELLVRDHDLDPQKAESVAGLSEGQMTRAFELLENDKRETVFDFVHRLNAGEDPLAVAEEFGRYLAEEKKIVRDQVKAAENRDELKEMSKEDRERVELEQQAHIDGLSRRAILEILHLVGSWYRDGLVLDATGETGLVLNRDDLEHLKSLRNPGGTDRLDAIEKARVYLERNIPEDRVFRDLFFVLAQ